MCILRENENPVIWRNNILKSLINMVNQYDEPDNDVLILKDEKWISITKKGKEIISKWFLGRT